jgi:lipopolysaccharide export system protein LptA
MNGLLLQLICLSRTCRVPFLILFVLFSLVTTAQEKKRIDILQAGAMSFSEKIVPDAQRLIDDVILKHNDALMYCDSAYSYTKVNTVDAFGHVHINQGDSVHLYADRVYYNGDISLARSIGNVRLQSRNATLYTDTLDYELNTNIGYYDDHGKIVDSINVLTSIIGRFFVDENRAWFYKDVKGVSEDYELYSDTISYNTETGRIYIESPATIRDSSGILYAKGGWYDTQTGHAFLTKDPVAFNEERQLKGNIIEYYRETGEGFANGAVEIYDLRNRMVVTGEKATYNDQQKTAMITDSAVLILYSREDSLYLHADTLRTVPDTIGDERIVKAYWGVRFWRTDIQGICDSLCYFSKDSTVQLFSNPILWSENRQLMADYIEMKSNAHTPDELRMHHNSFIVSKLDSVMFDQIKGRNMIGYVRENELFRIDVDGNGQTLYYAQDEGELIGLNKAESSKITIYFSEGRIRKISLITEAEGNLKPMFQLMESDRRLSGFVWNEDLRPVSKTDIF